MLSKKVWLGLLAVARAGKTEDDVVHEIRSSAKLSREDGDRAGELQALVTSCEAMAWRQESCGSFHQPCKIRTPPFFEAGETLAVTLHHNYLNHPGMFDCVNGECMDFEAHRWFTVVDNKEPEGKVGTDDAFHQVQIDNDGVRAFGYPCIADDFRNGVMQPFYVNAPEDNHWDYERTCDRIANPDTKLLCSKTVINEGLWPLGHLLLRRYEGEHGFHFSLASALSDKAPEKCSQEKPCEVHTTGIWEEGLLLRGIVEFEAAETVFCEDDSGVCPKYYREVYFKVVNNNIQTHETGKMVAVKEYGKAICDNICLDVHGHPTHRCVHDGAACSYGTYQGAGAPHLRLKVYPVEGQDSALALGMLPGEFYRNHCADVGLEMAVLMDASQSNGFDPRHLKAKFPHLGIRLQRMTGDRARFAFASYIDKPISPFGWEGDWCMRLESPLGRSFSVVEQGLLNLEPRGGFDWQEGTLDALLDLAWRDDVGWSDGTVTPDGDQLMKLIVVITDSGYHQAGDSDLPPRRLGPMKCTEQDYPDVQMVAKQLHKRNIIPLFLTSGRSTAVYENLAAEMANYNNLQAYVREVERTPEDFLDITFMVNDINSICRAFKDL